MSLLIAILSVMLVLLCAVIVFLILGQDVRGGGLAGALGGGSVQGAFGSKTTETVLKLTAYLAVGIFLIVVILIKLHDRESTSMTTPPTPITAPADARPTPPADAPIPLETP